MKKIKKIVKKRVAVNQAKTVKKANAAVVSESGLGRPISGCCQARLWIMESDLLLFEQLREEKGLSQKAAFNLIMAAAAGVDQVQKELQLHKS